MKDIKNTLMNSTFFYCLVANAAGFPILYYFFPVFSVVMLGMSILGMSLYFATIKWGRVYVTHYAGKAEIEAIREAGFNRGKNEIEAQARGYDISGWGQQGKDLVSFVSVHHKPVVAIRSKNSQDLVAIHMWVKPEDIFFSTMISFSWGIGSNYGTIVEVTADRGYVNSQIAAGYVDTEENKLYSIFSKFVTSIIVLSYPARANLNTMLNCGPKTKQPIIL